MRESEIWDCGMLEWRYERFEVGKLKFEGFSLEDFG
jgi:hypothetical protein